jgi:site-specific DNA recombinase
MGRKVALLGRVSGRQQESQATIETQVAVMEAYCSKRGYEVVGRYLDQNMRSIMPMEDRPECSRLIRDAELGSFEMVLVYAIDRVSRYRHISDPFLLRLKELGVAFDSATENLELASKEGQVLYAAKMAFAELERDTSQMRMRDGRYRVANEKWQHPDGRFYSYWLGGQCPYGYRVIEVRRRRAIVPNEDPIPGLDISEAQVVRWIYVRTVEERLSLVPIANRLNAMGVPTHSRLAQAWGRRPEPADTRWHMSTVRVILKNPIYRGERTHGGIEQTFPLIVSPETWHAAQAVIRDHQILASRNAQAEYLLRGKLICGCCGAALVGCPRYNKRGERWPDRHHYVCATVVNPKRFPERRCRNRRIDNRPVDALVWADIQEFIRDPGETLAILKTRLLGDGERQSRLQGEVDALKRIADQKDGALRNARRAMLNGVISEQEYLEDKAGIEGKLYQVREQIAGLEAYVRDSVQAQAQLREAADLLRTLQANPLDQSGDRRRLVELLVETVQITPEEIRVTYVFMPPPGRAAAKGNASANGNRSASSCGNSRRPARSNGRDP